MIESVRNILTDFLVNSFINFAELGIAIIFWL